MKRNLRAYCRFGLFLAAAVLFGLAGTFPVYGDRTTESQTRLLGDVKYLASDELEGRGVGSGGLNLAADYIRDEFAKAGLNVGPIDSSAFQKFSMVTGSELGSPNTLAFTGPDAETVALKYDADFRTCSFGGSGEFSGSVVFCGYGIDDAHYNDFAHLDVKGKIVIVIRRTPQQENPNSPFAGAHGGISRHADLTTKVSNASRREAAAILFVNDPYTTRKNAADEVKKATERVVSAADEFDTLDSQETKDEQKVADARQKLSVALKQLKIRKDEAKTPPDEPLMAFGYGGNGKDGAIPILHITQAACDRLLKASIKKTLKEIETEIDRDMKPKSVELTGVTLTGATAVTRVRAEVKNVIGVLEGSGPLADETIVVGAHYDHVGRGGAGSLAPGSKEIHNGADDNASGTASLVELARRLGQRKEKLPRRLVFIAFTGEELGLIGSAHYVKEPVFSLEKTVAMFNMDMVGRLQDDKLTVFGNGTSPRWNELLEPLAKKYEFKLSLKPDGFGPSDHTSFYTKKIPVLHFFTGNHSDYHRPSDDWDKINVPGMTRVVDLIEDAVVATALTPERPEYVEVKRPAQAERGGSRPYFGSIPDFGGDGPGYGISGAAPGSPADKGGLKAGDRIVQLGTQKITDLNDFDLALRKFSAGDEIEVVVLRNKEHVTLKVVLEKPK
jgi:hypothetical protein